MRRLCHGAAGQCEGWREENKGVFKYSREAGKWADCGASCLF